MNKHETALRALVWKDFRLVLPLALMLLAVAVFLMLLWSVMPVTSSLTAGVGSLIPVLLPALFAAGAGAILVGQERSSGVCGGLLRCRYLRGRSSRSS